MKIQHHISLKNLNTFGIDVTAREFISIENKDDLIELKGKINTAENLLFMGAGSNLLFTQNFDGLILHSVNKEITIIEENNSSVLLSVGAGLNWDEFVEYCLTNGWNGLENLSLIPGNVGSSPVQNIGAYGVEVSEFIETVFCFDFRKNEFCQLTHNELEFGYRNSIFKRRRELFIYEVHFRLSKKTKIKTGYAALSRHLAEKGIKNPTPIEVRKAVIEIRKSKLPDYKVLGNAGSFFKNPVIKREEFEELQQKFPEIPHYETGDDLVKIPAAWLIEKSGWKGVRKGNAGVHKDQALVLVNLGGAKGSEIAYLAEEIKDDIYKNFGIMLYPEVNIL